MADPETKDVPVIILTNLSGKHDTELALNKGAIEYWVKSDTDITKLGSRIKKILEPKEENTQNRQN